MGCTQFRDSKGNLGAMSMGIVTTEQQHKGFTQTVNNHSTEEPEFRNAPNSTVYTGFTPGSNTVYTGKQQRTTKGRNRSFHLLRVITRVWLLLSSAVILRAIRRQKCRLRRNFPYTIVHLQHVPSQMVAILGQ